jgi:hypothetical protein
MREQGVMLKHHVDRPPIGGDAGHVVAADKDLALARLLETRHHAQRRGLAAARRPEDRQEFTLPHRQVIVGNRHHLAEALGDVLNSMTGVSDAISTVIVLALALLRKRRRPCQQAMAAAVRTSVKFTRSRRTW